MTEYVNTDFCRSLYRQKSQKPHSEESLCY